MFQLRLGYVCCQHSSAMCYIIASLPNPCPCRKFAYEGAAPSRLSSSSSAAAATAAHDSTGAPQTATATSSHGPAPSMAAAVTPVQQQRQLRLSSSSGVKPGAKAAADARVVRQFMESHCSQLTPFGLLSLADSLKEHQLAVFFR